MKDLYSRFVKYSKNNILMSILMTLLGVVLIIWPGGTLTVAAHVLGIGLLVFAVVSGFVWYKGRSKSDSNYGQLAFALFGLILGIIVLAAPKGVITLLPKLIGLFILINGVVNLAQTLELRKASQSGWTSSLVMAVVTIALGLFLLFFAFSAMKAAVMVIGGVFVYNGVSNLWIESRYRKMEK